MIDVHPPHETVHTWRDFFIHIATIVVGLIIAIGLEQTVEWVHHRMEVEETGKALHRELGLNQHAFAQELAFARITRVDEKNNLLVLSYLKQHPGTPEERLPGILVWGVGSTDFPTSAWEDARRTGVTALMQAKDVRDYTSFYRYIDQANKAATDVATADNLAGEYREVDPNPSHFTPAQVDREITLTEHALELTRQWIDMLWNWQHYERKFVVFSPAIPDEERDSPHRSEEDKGMATAVSLTRDRQAPVLQESMSAFHTDAATR
jgi:hypothetical protein